MCRNKMRRRGITAANIHRSVEARHVSGVKIPDSHVARCAHDRNVFVVRSHGGQSAYFLRKVQDSCPQEHCSLKCSAESCGGLCIHMYICECDDSFKFCKHKHKVHSMLMKRVIGCYVLANELQCRALKERVDSVRNKLEELGGFLAHPDNQFLQKVLPQIEQTLGGLINHCRCTSQGHHSNL